MHRQKLDELKKLIEDELRQLYLKNRDADIPKSLLRMMDEEAYLDALVHAQDYAAKGDIATALLFARLSAELEPKKTPFEVWQEKMEELNLEFGYELKIEPHYFQDRSVAYVGLDYVQMRGNAIKPQQILRVWQLVDRREIAIDPVRAAHMAFEYMAMEIKKMLELNPHPERTRS